MQIVKFGGDSLVFSRESLDFISTLDCRSALIVTSGPFAAQSGQLAQITDRLEQIGAKHACFDRVEPNPEFDSVLAGAKVALELQPDWIIGLGGGSAMDAAKAIWVIYENPEIDTMDKIRHPDAIKKLREKARLLCVPTTSGTGSDATGSVVLSDSANNLKAAFGDRRLIPDAAVLDPSMTVNMPAALTAHTGMDALTHAIEANVSKLANEFSDAFAEKATQMVFRYLPLVKAEPGNVEYCEKMQMASTMAGMAFATVSLGITHSIAHAFGGVFHVPHGLANAIVLPYIIEYNKANAKAAEKYARLEMLCGIRDLTEAVVSLKSLLNIPATMQQVVGDDEKFEQMLPLLVRNALADRCTPRNPVDPTEADMQRLIRQVYYGK